MAGPYAARRLAVASRPAAAPCPSAPRRSGRARPHLIAVLDTSIFVAGELRRSLPDEVGVSVVTLAEQELGVVLARDPDARAQPLATFARVREETAGLPADHRVASAYARLAAS